MSENKGPSEGPGEKTGQGPSRRRMLASLGLVAGGAAVAVAGPVGSAHAAAPAAPAETDPAVPAPRTWTKATTQNGWPVVSAGAGGGYTNLRIEGTSAVVALRPGDAATVLEYVARRFHYEVRALKSGDVFGWTTHHSVTTAYESNYLSGTALSILPGLYPAGVAGGLYPLEQVVVRDILASCEGVVRWGGDDPDVPKEGHFQIDVPPGASALRDLAAKLSAARTTPGQGAGAFVDPFAAGRRSAAKAMERRQRAA